MNKNLLKYFLIMLIFALLIAPQNVNAQVSSFSIGGYLGMGSIKGNTSSQTSFAGSVFIDAAPSLLSTLTVRLSYMYARKIEYFLPEDRENRYYPFVQAVTLKGLARQYIAETLYLEEGFGFLYLNDRTISNVNDWNYGIVFNLLGGIDLRQHSSTGVSLGLGTEYGLTFTNATATYLQAHLQVQYFFF